MSRPQIVNLTLEDLGTDALPVEKYIDALEAERDRWQKQALEWGEECESVSDMLQAAGEDAVEIKQEHAELVAHVERLTSITEKLSTVAPEYLDHLASDAAFVLREAPEASLARRDARVKAEALESLASSSLVGDLHKELIRRCAEEYRQQAEGGGDE